jgi:hypothetical protein
MSILRRWTTDTSDQLYLWNIHKTGLVNLEDGRMIKQIVDVGVVVVVVEKVADEKSCAG